MRLLCEDTQANGVEKVLPTEDGLMLEFEQAAELAQKFLDEEVGSPDFPMALVRDEHARIGKELFFDCQSAAYLESGDLSDMAIGTGYVCVDLETGACRLLGAVESVQMGLFEDDEESMDEEEEEERSLK
ncbi:hypothetical protein V1L54_01085 [Streptomyces sp. TRM 70361]|uniref:hypothetical protein n=1 Tax=Streptomyces sp. TRM 70361 TaxID=3116553 RepID=UPI002E7BE09C|nr:hypothetical protein [Streptomyces sp. TRM 70361]MEE1938025.1 hypothetical protein [Streptomyces sp. TRM 70361]